MAQLPDAELLRSSNRVHFGVFYERHVDVVAAYFARRTSRSDQVFDLVAETFARALANRSRFDPQRGPAIAWLLGIARNLLIDTARAGRVADDVRRRLRMQPVSLDDPRIAAIDRRTGLDLEVLLQQLPEDQREAVRRRIVDEEPYSDIAEQVGCSEHVARQRVSRGLAVLRRTVRTPNE